MVDEYDVVASGRRFILLIRVGLSVEGVLSNIAVAHCEYIHTFALVGSCGISSEANIALQAQGFYFQEHHWRDQLAIGQTAERSEGP